MVDGNMCRNCYDYIDKIEALEKELKELRSWQMGLLAACTPKMMRFLKNPCVSKSEVIMHPDEYEEDFRRRLKND